VPAHRAENTCMAEKIHVSEKMLQDMLHYQVTGCILQFSVSIVSDFLGPLGPWPGQTTRWVPSYSRFACLHRKLMQINQLRRRCVPASGFLSGPKKAMSGREETYDRLPRQMYMHITCVQTQDLSFNKLRTGASFSLTVRY
jgi:hypothetical protein